MLSKLPEGVRVGSYSTGTLRDQDVGPVMMALLVKLSLVRANIYKQDWSDVIDSGFNADELMKVQRCGEDSAGETVAAAMVDLHETIDDLLPRGFRWGSAEGDGADFGIWQVDTGDGPDDTTESQDDVPVVEYRAESSNPVIGEWSVSEYRNGGFVAAKSGWLLWGAQETAKLLNNVVRYGTIKAPPMVRRRYVAEQLCLNVWGVHEYKGDTLVRRVGPSGLKNGTSDWANVLNDAIHRFMEDNDLHVPDA